MFHMFHPFSSFFLVDSQACGPKLWSQPLKTSVEAGKGKKGKQLIEAVQREAGIAQQTLSNPMKWYRFHGKIIELNGYTWCLFSFAMFDHRELLRLDQYLVLCFHWNSLIL